MLKLSNILEDILKDDDIVKNKKTGNVYMVKKMDPIKHDIPTKKPTNSKLKPSKRTDSKGNQLGNIQTKNGSTFFGMEHYNLKGAQEVVDDVKKIYPQDSKIAFLGEGGDDDNIYVKGSEQEYIHNKLKEHYPNFVNDSWDGKDLNVMNDQSRLYKEQMKRTGLPLNIVKAGNWASMVGQNKNTNDFSSVDYLDETGKQYLQKSAKEAGFPPIQNFEKPKKRDYDILYRLSFPADYNDKKTSVGELADTFNDIRDENLIRKTKELESKGYKVIAPVGDGHIDLLKNKNQK